MKSCCLVLHQARKAGSILVCEFGCLTHQMCQMCLNSDKLFNVCTNFVTYQLQVQSFSPSGPRGFVYRMSGCYDETRISVEVQNLSQPRTEFYDAHTSY